MGKLVKLRAFKITKNNISDDQTNLFALLSERLEQSPAKDRRLLLNENDPDKEEDLICDYYCANNMIFGALLRIRSSENIPEIPDHIFEENKINLDQLQNLELSSSLHYKNHYYFLLSDNFLIVTLRGNITITHFQTYINWLLENVRSNNLFEFTPKVKLPPNMPLMDLKQIKVQDPARRETDAFDLTETKKFSLELLSSFFKDVTSLDEVKLSEVVSAELLLKFRKPKSMSNEEYENAFGAYLKPISDLENVTFYPKKGSPITGEEIEEKLEVEIETTSSGKISEQHLKQAMEKYLKEIQNV